MDLVIFEQNKPLVFEALGNVEFDDIGSASEVFETEFFRFIKAKAILDKFAETCPSTRKKEMVPLWFYVAGNISMRLHGVHSFNAFPLVVRSGGFLNVLGPKGLRRSHIRTSFKLDKQLNSPYTPDLKKKVPVNLLFIGRLV
jgi:hypothetical protein